jgi:hypothetical protein
MEAAAQAEEETSTVQPLSPVQAAVCKGVDMATDPPAVKLMTVADTQLLQRRMGKTGVMSKVPAGSYVIEMGSVLWTEGHCGRR